MSLDAEVPHDGNRICQRERDTLDDAAKQVGPGVRREIARRTRLAQMRPRGASVRRSDMAGRSNARYRGEPARLPPSAGRMHRAPPSRPWPEHQPARTSRNQRRLPPADSTTPMRYQTSGTAWQNVCNRAPWIDVRCRRRRYNGARRAQARKDIAGRDDSCAHCGAGVVCAPCHDRCADSQAGHDVPLRLIPGP